MVSCEATSKADIGLYATGRQWGWLSANDVREREDMNRIDAGDLYLAPTNMTPSEKLAATEITSSKGLPNAA